MTVRFSALDLARLKKTIVRVIAHGDSYGQCRVPTNLAWTQKQGDDYEIIICARQIRFMLHFMDAFTTVGFDSEGQRDVYDRSLDSGDREKVEALLVPIAQFYTDYEDYIIVNLSKEINHVLGGDELIAYQCGSDYFKMLRDQRKDFAHCTHAQELSDQSEFTTWYYSTLGPGGRFAAAMQRASGQSFSPEDVRAVWNIMHEEVNKIAVYFVILHEVGHIINGDPDRKAKVDDADRSDVRAEAAADLWAMKMSAKRSISKIPLLPAIVAGTVIMYVRNMCENGPTGPSQTTGDTKARIGSLGDYESAMAALPSESGQEAKMKQRMLALLSVK